MTLATALRYEDEPTHILRVPNAHRLSIDTYHSACLASPFALPFFLQRTANDGVSLRSTGWTGPLRDT
jgi:hypothetical protein